MSGMGKRWYRSRRNQFIIVTIIAICIIYYISLNDSLQREPDLDLTRRNSLHESILSKIEEALKEDKGTGCAIPHLDPFAKEVTQFDKVLPKVTCKGKDWVKCYHSECRVVDEILKTTKDIECTYNDIIYESDYKYHIGQPTAVKGGKPYILNKSDHVKIKCVGKHEDRYTKANVKKLGPMGVLMSRWVGYSLGFRKSVERKPSPVYREDSLNVLIFGFDSTSKNGFIRRMPKSYQYLTTKLQGTILNGYNIVGDGTPAALFPILTGKTELELPDVRKKLKNNGTMDSFPFIFHKLKEDGYRTAYFEDMPWIGTFQYRFNGFGHQPADHYLRSFYLEESSQGKKWWKTPKSKYCVGDTPQYRLMMNITDQFLLLDGKRFCFTFIADITHDDFNMISTADEDMVKLLETLVKRDTFRDTLLIIFGDHGTRYAKVRDTLQGKLEERLPLMYVLLPEMLARMRPTARGALAANADTLSTPHDIYATVLDVLDLPQHMNPYKVAGADFPRGMSLLEPIPKNRSCSEAGIEPHWCACLAWKNVSEHDRLFTKAAEAFMEFINTLTEPVRSQCVPRTLTGIKWVMRQRANNRMLSFLEAKDADGYIGKFGAKIKIDKENFQLKVAVGPGHGIYEASLTYLHKEDDFLINTRDISRTNAYGEEPSCISTTHPHLNMYCYCKNYVSRTD